MLLVHSSSTIASLQKTTTAAAVPGQWKTRTTLTFVIRPSSMDWASAAVTFGRGTSHLPAFSLRFCLIVLLSTLARST
jgi:hypothetical protein